MSSYDLDGCDAYIFFPFRNAGRQSSSPRCIIILNFVYIKAGIDNLPVHLGHKGTNND